MDSDAESILQSIDSSGSSWAILNPDLEGSLGTTKKSDNTSALTSLIYSFSTWAKLKSDVPNFHSSLEKALTHIGVSLP
jgi:hypothetical protein